jgi:integrase
MTLFMTINSPENGKLNRKGNPKRAGIDIDNKLSFNKHITTHIFRHTHISFLGHL